MMASRQVRLVAKAAPSHCNRRSEGVRHGLASIANTSKNKASNAPG